MNRSWILSAILPFLALPAPAQSPDTARPDTARADAARPALEVRRAPGPVRVDGELDDAGWEGAARATGFVEFHPREDATPPEETEALLTYDDQNLYVAFVARGDPGQIRASLRNRDEIYSDDHVGILIDPYGQAALGYFLLSNPLGVQGDILMSPQGEDGSFDALFETYGRITPEGYVVEMAIPFRSLRFPDRPVQSWKINLYRNLPRGSRHQIAWAPLSRGNPCLLCQNGTLAGIEGVRPGGGLELLPSVVASQAGSLREGTDPGSFRNEDPSADVSLGAKYAFQSGWTVEGTYNPDFSQVESDAAQIDVNTTFALFFPERRPFFQEGSELFDTWVNVAYTRSINDPVVAGKLTGRRGGTSVAYIGAVDEHTPFILPFEERSAVLQAGRSVSNVARVRHNVYEGSYVGGMLTDRRLVGGGAGSTAGIDALLRFRKVYQLEAQLVGSYTQEPEDSALTSRLGGLEFGRGDDVHTAAFDGESFAGRASYVSLERSGRFWNLDLDYWDATPTFRADNGFQTRNDFRRAVASTSLNFYPGTRGVERVSPSFRVGQVWNFAGERKELSGGPGLYMLLARQTNVNLNTSFRRETFRGVEFDGLRGVGLSVNSNFSDVLQGGFYLNRSRTIARNLRTPVLGTGNSFGVSATIKPVQRLIVQPSLNYADLSRLDTGEEVFSGYIFRTRANYQFTRELSLRLVAQYDDFGESVDLEPLLVYRLNPFSIFYVGSTHGYRDFGDELGLAGTDRQFFLKFQYLFRR